ncbi:MAG: helix-turn-helix domain-containing protein [Dehalococcoidia bacterium]|nr:helix-turn-helix domain-containing protein [Dehalococcoidia bacterium]
MAPDDLDARLASVSALGDPVRRSLYRYVIAQPDAVSRDDAAAGVGVPRHVAKFHLDRLEEDGLLEAEFRRPPGRTGPGAGRPAKLYRRSSRELAVSLPERRYDFAGRIMATAIATAERDSIPVADALRDAAAAFGRELAEQARARGALSSGPDAGLVAAQEVLAEYGYEPRSDVDAGGFILANCPFHALAQDYTDLVCGMNLHLIQGFLEALETAGLEARLDPAPARCCVTVCHR